MINLSEFDNCYPTEDSCLSDIRKRREQMGIICKRCGGAKHYWVSSLQRWECAVCKSCINLRSGTIMEKSHLPLRAWYLGLYLVSKNKEHISILQIQKQIGWKRYEPIWHMMNKIHEFIYKKNSSKIILKIPEEDLLDWVLQES